MKTKGRKKDKVNIVTLGCSKNIVDSEVMLTQLKGNGINAHHESTKDDANIVVINTCGFIENAKQESIDTILRYVDAKNDGQVEKVFVSGCLSHRYKDELKEEIGGVDAWFGTSDLPILLKKLNANYKKELLGERILTTANHFAYLKISEGCDRPCSFCAIPIMRGKHKSKPIENIILEAQNLAANGTKELLVIAQDSTYYGLDLYGKRSLSELLMRLSDVKGIEWIRLHYAFPAGFPMDIIDVMADRNNICNYLDIPLQHGSSKMLKLMRRGIDRPRTEDLIHQIRDRVPGIAIRTTMITGHPGETEEDFNELLRFAEEFRFDRMGVFTYSHEEDTHAFTLTDDVSEEVKQERASELMALQENISRELNEDKVGRHLKVMVDRYESGYHIGRTEYDSPEVDNEVLIKSDQNHLRIGDFTKVKITDASEFDLYAEVTRDS